MDAFANALIDGMGGTTVVSNRSRASTSTVHSWRVKGLPPSRLDHLRRIIQDECPSVNVEELATLHGVELPPIGEAEPASSGMTAEVSDQVPA
jgi:hypothetical protein